MEQFVVGIIQNEMLNYDSEPATSNPIQQNANTFKEIKEYAIVLYKKGNVQDHLLL